MGDHGMTMNGHGMAIAPPHHGTPWHEHGATVNDHGVAAATRGNEKVRWVVAFSRGALGADKWRVSLWVSGGTFRHAEGLICVINAFPMGQGVRPNTMPPPKTWFAVPLKFSSKTPP